LKPTLWPLQRRQACDRHQPPILPGQRVGRADPSSGAPRSLYPGHERHREVRADRTSNPTPQPSPPPRAGAAVAQLPDIPELTASPSVIRAPPARRSRPVGRSYVRVVVSSSKCSSNRDQKRYSEHRDRAAADAFEDLNSYEHSAPTAARSAG
jgi:hypothetical protein